MWGAELGERLGTVLSNVFLLHEHPLSEPSDEKDADDA